MKEIPKKDENIYPKNSENIKALLNYYFRNCFIGNIEEILKFDITLNQIEFISKETSKHTKFLEGKVGESGKNASNYLKYGIDAMYISEYLWNGSANRKNITKMLKEKIIENQI